MRQAGVAAKRPWPFHQRGFKAGSEPVADLTPPEHRPNWSKARTHFELDQTEARAKDVAHCFKYSQEVNFKD